MRIPADQPCPCSRAPATRRRHRTDRPCPPPLLDQVEAGAEAVPRLERRDGGVAAGDLKRHAPLMPGSSCSANAFYLLAVGPEINASVMAAGDAPISCAPRGASSTAPSSFGRLALVAAEFGDQRDHAGVEADHQAVGFLALVVPAEPPAGVAGRILWSRCPPPRSHGAPPGSCQAPPRSVRSRPRAVPPSRNRRRCR
jgi:hypothetical protein